MVKTETARREAPTAAPAEPSFDVPKLSRNTLNEEVYEQLKQALIAGRIAPGSTMTIRSLANSFGISVMPVREALRRLVAEHVLYLLPNRTVALPVFTRERFHEITRIRTSLEGLAAEEATAHIGQSGIDHMIAMNARMEQDSAAGATSVLEWNREFHFCLYRNSQMPMLVKMIESLWLQIGPLLNIQQATFSRQNITTYVRHHRTLDGLKRRKAKEVREAIVGDIEDAAKIISAGL